jgi:Holliday junction resolvasome RuvABC DNA-binding subunit
MPRIESKVQASTDGSADVIAALVQAGYKKPEAAEATWGCSAAERATIERWTGAALRRCALRAMS